MNGIVVLVVVALIVAVARSRHIDDGDRATGPTPQPPAPEATPILTPQEVAALRAQIARAEAEAAMARDAALNFNRAKGQAGDPAEVAALATALEQARQRAAEADAENARLRYKLQKNADTIAAEQARAAAAAVAMAPRKAALLAENRALEGESADVTNAWNLLRAQRQAMAAAFPEYKDLLGYRIVGDIADSEEPYASPFALVDADSEDGRQVARLRNSSVTAVGWEAGGRTTRTDGSGIRFSNVLLVTGEMRESARRIDEATVHMREARARMNDIKVSIERNAAEVAAINESLTGNAKGVVGAKVVGGGTAPNLPLILPILHK